MSNLLEGKRILVTGIITDASIAFHAAKAAQEAGATVVLTGFGRLSLVKRVAKRLPTEAPVIELDVQNREHLDGLADAVREHVDGLDGVLHSIGFAPMDALGGNFLHTEWKDVATAVEVSAYSFKALAMACRPLLGPGSSLVGMDFDNSAQAWPGYDWMGVAKAALQATTRYLARDLGPEGIRANLVAAGPVRTMAAKSIPGFDTFEEAWIQRSPLGWDLADPTPVAKTICALLSDYMPATTGEVIHADGGYHAMGA